MSFKLNSLKAITIATFAAVSGVSVAAQTLTQFTLTNGVAGVRTGQFQIGNHDGDGEGAPNLYDISQLTGTGYAFNFASQLFTPSAAGQYTFGMSSAPFDAVLILYKGVYDPANPGQNAVALNDDHEGSRPDGIVMGACGNVSRLCPQLTEALEEGVDYYVVLTTYGQGGEVNLPIGFYVFGAPVGVGGAKLPVAVTGFEQIVKAQQGLVPLASADAARVLDQLASGGSSAIAPVIAALRARLANRTELAKAVEQLTPALPSVALSAVSDSLGAINRVVQARIEGNTGLSSGDEMSAERYVWVKPFGSYARQETRRETAGFKANTGGLVFGADAALGPKLRLGAAFAYAHSDVDGRSTSAPQSSKVDIYQLVGYGSVQLDGNTELNFQLDTGRNRNRGERQLPFMGMTARSDYDSLSYHVGAGVGRTFTFPREINTTPSLRLDYTRIKEDSYRETGAGAASLTNGKRAVEQTLLAVDNRVTLPLSARQSVAINAGAAYDLMDDDATLTSAFAGEPGAVFSTTAAGQSRWLWRAGLGYTYKADTGKGGLELTTRLDGEWRKGGYSNATASVKARYAF